MLTFYQVNTFFCLIFTYCMNMTVILSLNLNTSLYLPIALVKNSKLSALAKFCLHLWTAQDHTDTHSYCKFNGRGKLCPSGHYSSDQVDTWWCSRGLTEVTHSQWQHKKTLLIHFPSLFPPLRSPVNLFCEIQQCLSASLTAPLSPEMGSLMRVQLIFTRWDCDGKEGRERGEGRGIWFSQWEYGN